MTYVQAMAEAEDLKATMTRWGVRSSIELMGGRGSDPWAVPMKPLRMHHHTAAHYVPGGNQTPCLALVKTGRPDVIGPLCNGYGGFDLVYRIICMGLANHPGFGGPITIDGVHIPKDSARGPTWGTEWEGGYEDWETIPGMLEFMGRADNALAEWANRPITSQMEHKTWAPDRKVDRKDFTRARGISLTSYWHPRREDDMDIPDLRGDLGSKTKTSRQLIKEIATGAGVDALRERTEAHPEYGAWRGLIEAAAEEAAERAIRRVLTEAGLLPPKTPEG